MPMDIVMPEIDGLDIHARDAQNAASGVGNDKSVLVPWLRCAMTIFIRVF